MTRDVNTTDEYVGCRKKAAAVSRMWRFNAETTQVIKKRLRCDNDSEQPSAAKYLNDVDIPFNLLKLLRTRLAEKKKKYLVRQRMPLLTRLA
jgi:hypothetical protein